MPSVIYRCTQLVTSVNVPLRKNSEYYKNKGHTKRSPVFSRLVNFCLSGCRIVLYRFYIRKYSDCCYSLNLLHFFILVLVTERLLPERMPDLILAGAPAVHRLMWTAAAQELIYGRSSDLHMHCVCTELISQYQLHNAMDIFCLFRECI